MPQSDGEPSAGHVDINQLSSGGKIDSDNAFIGAQSALPFEQLGMSFSHGALWPDMHDPPVLQQRHLCNLRDESMLRSYWCLLVGSSVCYHVEKATAVRMGDPSLQYTAELAAALPHAAVWYSVDVPSGADVPPNQRDGDEGKPRLNLLCVRTRALPHFLPAQGRHLCCFKKPLEPD